MASPGRSRRAAGAITALLAIAGAGVWWTAARRSPAASPVTPADLRALTDQDGKPFSFARLRGHTVAMNFVFTHCPVSCPMQTRALAAVQRALPASLHGRVHFVSVTMDPARDTPPVMKQYAAAMGADLAGWSFVTGA